MGEVPKKAIKEKHLIPWRPTGEAHFGSVENSKTFQQAFDAVLQNPDKLYRTNAGTPFMAEAKVTSKGPHMGEKVIIFTRDGNEMARSYQCCWGKQVNCNRTYIDSYTPVI